MINVIAPPGCYGTYIARCLHHYTSQDDKYCLDFDTNGSSHAFREIKSNTRKTSLTHWQHPRSATPDGANTIIITGEAHHYLDYFDNQFYKNSHGDLIEYLTSVFGLEKIQQHLKEGWNYNELFDIRTPQWILREYCSYSITNTWLQGYNNEKYLAIPHVYSFCCEDLWTVNMWQLINTLTTALSQKIHAPETIVQQNHQTFLMCQQYHGMQLRCEQFATDTINGVDSKSPCVSIFDEAYVQHILRKQGYEIHCDNLDQFPTSSNQLAKIIYETSNHSNP